MPDPLSTSPPPRASAPPPKRNPHAAFLTLYNAASALLWTVVLGRTVGLYLLMGPFKVHRGVGLFVTWTQTLAVLEIGFSLLGIVRAPLVTTTMQVFSRLFLIWGVVHCFGDDTAFSRAYSSMLLAWSVTEVIRYSFFAVNLAFGAVPDALLWLRYNTFFVLYPLGIASEVFLIWRSWGPAGQLDPRLTWVWLAVLLTYIPGSYVLYTHMMAQRRKVLRAARADKVAKTQ